MIDPTTRRKFRIDRRGRLGWISRSRTPQEVKHLNAEGTHHPSTTRNDEEAAIRIGATLPLEL